MIPHVAMSATIVADIKEKDIHRSLGSARAKFYASSSMLYWCPNWVNKYRCDYRDIDYGNIYTALSEHFVLEGGHARDLFGNRKFYNLLRKPANKEEKQEVPDCICVDGEKRTARIVCCRQTYEFLCEKGLFNKATKATESDEEPF